MSFAGTLAGVWRLSSRQRRQLPVAVGLLLLTRLSIRVQRVGATQRRLERWVVGRSRCEGGERTPGFDLLDARALAEVVDAVAVQRGIGADCLCRSLVLWAWLQRRGQPAQLRFGVRRLGSAIVAHAWVELDGAVVNDTDEVAERYAPFPAPGPRTRWA